MRMCIYIYIYRYIYLNRRYRGPNAHGADFYHSNRTMHAKLRECVGRTLTRRAKKMRKFNVTAVLKIRR